MYLPFAQINKHGYLREEVKRMYLPFAHESNKRFFDLNKNPTRSPFRRARQKFYFGGLTRIKNTGILNLY